MRMLNCQVVPENLSIQELQKMMETTDMQIFAIACEALRIANNHEAYEVLKSYIDTRDKYKHRCVLAAIFEYSEASELRDHLIRALFEMFANSSLAKVRMVACRIVCKFRRYDLLQRYMDDSDGHIRKYVKIYKDDVVDEVFERG